MAGSDYLNNWFLTLQLRIIMKSNLRISFHEYLSRKSRHTVGNSKVRGEQQCSDTHLSSTLRRYGLYTIRKDLY